MAIKKVFTDESLDFFVDKVKSYTDDAVSKKANTSHNHDASDITSGILSVERLSTVPISKGGTGATTAAGALTNLGITATAAELNIMDGVTATATELNYCDGVTANIQTQLNAKQAKTATVSGSGTISVTLADNTEYRYTGVTKLTLAYPSGNFESWIRITVGTSANATVSFPSGTTYIGSVPTFAAGKTYEISIKDKIVVIGEVG